MAGASEDTLSTIHSLAADWCLARLRARDEDGQPTLSASEFAAIKAFLKDNDITCAPSDGNAVQKLKEELARKRSRLVVPVDPVLDLGLGPETMQ
jgi:hypothetical protein